MPLKVGGDRFGFVVSLHRSDAQKALLEGDKERFQRLNNDPSLHPPKTSKPFVEFQRVSIYNRYPSVRAVNRAIADIPPTSSTRDLRIKMRADLTSHRMLKGGEPNFVLLGDLHGNRGGAAMALTALHEFRATPGVKRLLLEYPPAQMHALFRNPGVNAQFAGHLQADTQVNFGTTHAETINTFSIALYANHLGFEVSGHDPRKDNAPDQTHREDAMVRTIANSLTDANLTIVLVGTHHVPKLHEELEYRANTFTFAMMNKAMPGDTDTVKRASYLLSTPEIVKVNPGSALLETSPPLDAVNFINHQLR